ncbi:MAG: phenylacetate-CoA oxygenase subunit PaaJ, partial [Alphaproteobacteria bacterium]|nr:phenylacetate-CoA oxygenase subunit PaaJ [Alphaproteobacteria bacterium]
MVKTAIRADEVFAILQQVHDPEIPVLSVVDLGIVREVRDDAVAITPTYSGCPATLVIEQAIRQALDAAGLQKMRIETVLFPPWTTDWITAEGHRKLEAYGIAPPQPS